MSKTSSNTRPAISSWPLAEISVTATSEASATAGGTQGASNAVEPCLLRLEHISKRFGQVQVLTDVSFDIPAGQVTALTGDNGAGKSVLIKCIAGIHTPDTGRILWRGEPVRIRRPADASALGIETVYQDLALCDNLDVAENMFLGRERNRHGLLTTGPMEIETRETLRDLSVTTLRSVHQRVGSLSGGQRQAVAIAKAVLWHSKLVIMDEPTAALGVRQTEVVLQLVHRLAERGLAVILISHNMNDVFKVADRVAVLFLGRLAGVYRTQDVDTQVVVQLMTSGHSPRLDGLGIDGANDGPGPVDRSVPVRTAGGRR